MEGAGALSTGKDAEERIEAPSWTKPGWNVGRAKPRAAMVARPVAHVKVPVGFSRALESYRRIAILDLISSVAPMRPFEGVALGLRFFLGCLFGFLLAASMASAARLSLSYSDMRAG
jgi:hypothetical protein